MKIRIVTLLALATLLLTAFKSEADKGAVYFIPTLHNYHDVNPHYSYDSLRSIVASLNPDIIAVEIRPEDIKADSAYLDDNYPYEMLMMRNWFPNVEFLGFDWLGEELEGRMIPEGYGKSGQSAYKEAEKRLSQDSLYMSKLSVCFTRMRERMSLIRNSSLEQLLVSADGEITRQYHECREKVLKGSPYEEMVIFTNKRDDKIVENINRIIESNKGKRIVILTGDDHYHVLKDKIKHNELYPSK